MLRKENEEKGWYQVYAAVYQAKLFCWRAKQLKTGSEHKAPVTLLARLPDTSAQHLTLASPCAAYVFQGNNCQTKDGEWGWN